MQPLQKVKTAFMAQEPSMGQRMLSVLLAYCFVFHELHLKPRDLTPECVDLLTGSVLIDHHLVLDISSSIGIFQSV